MNEEIELRIFDYLEGNLNESEAKEVRQLVQNNPEWRRAYRLMQHTYLNAEALQTQFLYPDKERLYQGTRKHRRFLLYYSAAASLLLCGLTYLFWKSSAADPRVVGLAQKQEVEATMPGKRQLSSIRSGVRAPRAASKQLAEQHVEINPEPQMALFPQAADSLILASLYARKPLLVSTSLQGPYPSGAVRFINGNYVPLMQRRSLLRYRLLDEGRELLAWVSEPRLLLVRTERAGARDRMELRLETKKIGIIATITD
jgi:hypothetical protein